MDFRREGIRLLAQLMMEADVTAQIGAALGEHARDERTNAPQWLPGPPVGHPRRHGQVGDPKLRSGSYFPDFLLEPRRRAEKALASVVI